MRSTVHPEREIFLPSRVSYSKNSYGLEAISCVRDSTFRIFKKHQSINQLIYWEAALLEMYQFEPLCDFCSSKISMRGIYQSVCITCKANPPLEVSL